ncbi:MAG TPA: hypothetical protein VFB45_08505 [Pseudolabrys sp.]|nr:hypothetical protein [Pseudolabrys sp.]
MIRFLLRFLGLLSLAIAFILVIYDGTKSIAGNAVFITKLGDLWNNIHASSLQLLQTSIERHADPLLWQFVVQPVLQQPSWLVLAILGIVLILLGRKKKPLIGYAR